jgi:hypothetical protein
MVILQESFGLGRCNVMNKHFIMHLLCGFFCWWIAFVVQFWCEYYISVILLFIIRPDRPVNACIGVKLSNVSKSNRCN